MLRISPVLMVLIGLGLFVGCDSNTAATCEDAGPLGGLWTYSSIESSASSPQRKGTFEIEADACPDLRGTFDVVEMDASGTRVRDTGPVYGVKRPDGARLNLVSGTSRIEHSGVLTGDTLHGDWITVRDGEVFASGTFEATRRLNP